MDVSVDRGTKVAFWALAVTVKAESSVGFLHVNCCLETRVAGGD